MKDNTPSLEVKEDGQIWLIPECPVEPNAEKYGVDARNYTDRKKSQYYRMAFKKYDKALASAERILVSDQEVAKELIWTERTGLPFAEPITIKPGIYPIPDLKWEVMTWSKTVGFKESKFQPGFLPVVDHQKVAVISLPEPDKEQRKKLLIEMMQEDEKYGMYEPSKGDLKETQEAMWNYVDFLINDPALPPRSWEQIRKQLAVEFTITRKS